MDKSNQKLYNKGWLKKNPIIIFSIKDYSMNSFIKFKSQMSVEKLDYSAFQRLSDFWVLYMNSLSNLWLKKSCFNPPPFFKGWGVLSAPPYRNYWFDWKQVYFSILSSKTTNLWLIATFHSLFHRKLKILQPFQNRDISCQIVSRRFSFC